MSLGIDTVIQVADLIRSAIEIYNRVKEVPIEVKKLGRRLERLTPVLDRLEGHMRANSKHALVRLREAQQSDLVSIIDETRASCKKVYDIFNSLERQVIQVGSVEFELRFTIVAQFLHAYGPGSAAINELSMDIDLHRRDIDTYLSLIGVEGLDQNHKAIVSLQKKIDGLQALLLKKTAETPPQVPRTSEADAQIKRLEKQLAVAQLQVKAKEKQLEEQQAKAEAKEKQLTEAEARRKAREMEAKDKKEKEKEKEAKEAKEAKGKDNGPKDSGSKKGEVTKDEKKPSKSPTPEKDNNNNKTSKPKSPVGEKLLAVPNSPQQAPSKPSPQSSPNLKPKKAALSPNIINVVKEAEPPKIINVVREPQHQSPDHSSQQKKTSPKPPPSPTFKKASLQPAKPPHLVLKPSSSALSSTSGTAKKSPAPPPSPSPLPPRDDYAVLFVDPYNQDRGPLSKAILALLALQTKSSSSSSSGSSSKFRVATAHSAGFFVRNSCDCVAEIEGLDFARPSYNTGFLDGGVKPKPVACDALFDNNSYSCLSQNERDHVEQRLRGRLTIGVNKGIFQNYDYILCFTGREHENLLRLREALVTKYGAGMRRKGKGRIIHLGRYLSADGIAKEITTVPRDVKQEKQREEWNRKVAQLKTAVKGFLKEEMGWVPPETTTKPAAATS